MGASRRRFFTRHCQNAISAKLRASVDVEYKKLCTHLQYGGKVSTLLPLQPKPAIMKKLFVVLISATLIISCNDAKKEAEVAKNSDWTAQNLKGMVQTVESTNYTPDSTGKIAAMDSCCITVDKFDKNGYINSSTKKDSKGTETEKVTMTHYEKGQMKSVATTKSGKPSNGFEIEIDKDGKYSGAHEKDSTGKATFYYTGLTEDDYGQVTAGTRHKADSTVDGVFSNEYVKGMQVAGTYKDSSGKEVSNSKSELNDKGDIAKTTEMNVTKDSTTNTVTTYKYDSYDEQGNWTQRTSYNEKGKATKVVKRSFTYYKKD